MSVNDVSFVDNEERICNCGRSKDRRHCPYCGYMNYYGLKDRIKRPHPSTGEMIDNISVFRCRSCNKNFDDLQWEFECKAPPSLRTQQLKKKEESKQSLIKRANDGVKFNDNDKRHFEKIVGIKYDEYMLLLANAKQHVDKAVHKLSNNWGRPMPIFKNRKLTPLEYHIENCNYCMTHDDNCEVARQLEIAEKMEQP